MGRNFIKTEFQALRCMFWKQKRHKFPVILLEHKSCFEVRHFTLNPTVDKLVFAMQHRYRRQ